MNNFITKMFHYIEGELCIIEETFERIEEAIECGIRAACHSFKVYDHDGCLCHHHHHCCHHGPYC